MSARDPILAALQDGDEHCPDGRQLAALGRLVRSGSRPPEPVDLQARVRAACAPYVDAQASADDALVDDLYDGDRASAAAADPDLRALGELVRVASRPEREPDLLPQIERRLRHPHPSSRRARAEIDPHTSWRIWTMVVVGHVAALFALAVINIKLAEDPESDGGNPLIYSAELPEYADRSGLPPGLPRPATWGELHGQPEGLFALRTDPDLREQARRHYGLARSAGTVRGALDWLGDRYHPRRGIVGPLSGDLDIDVATQSLATLAFLGEGLAAPERATMAQAVSIWLAGRVEDFHQLEPTAAGLAALALVEAAILLEDPELAAAARRALVVLADAPLDTHGGAWLLLAAETARVAGWPVPTRLDARHLVDIETRDVLAVQVTSGVTAGTRVIARLVEAPPAVDARGRVDLLGLWTDSLAMREMGGRLWSDWARDLSATLLPLFAHSDDGRSWLPAAHVRHAPHMGETGEVFATALGLLSLQSAYRYVPLAP